MCGPCAARRARARAARSAGRAPSTRRRRRCARGAAARTSARGSASANRGSRAVVARHPTPAMTADEPDDPWVRTLALRLRSLYARPLPGAADRTLGDELDRRLAALHATAGTARYRVLRTLAQGGMGSVVLAFDEAVGRQVAIKRAAVAADAAEAARHRLRLLAEAATIGRLQHPGIVPVHDLGTDADGQPFFAMQWIEGRSLHELLGEDHARDGREHALLRVVDVLLRVCDTMAYAHARGVVHRDLKPANIMVGAYGEVYVVDWGLARAIDEPAAPLGDATVTSAKATGVQLTASGTVLGTPSYMPPERAAEAGGVAGVAALPAADIYGVGAILYEALPGSPPYARERADWTVTEVLAAIRTRPPQPVRELAPRADPELAAICARAMHRDAAARYPDMRSLAGDLRAFVEHRIVSAHGGGPGTQLRKWIRRNRALAATIALGVTALAAVCLWFVDGLATARDAADASLREVLDLAVVEQVADLRRRADDELWPLGVERAAATAAWLQQAEALRPVRDRLRARRDRFARPAGAVDGDNRDAAVAQWRLRLLGDAVAALDAFFADPPPSPALSLDSTFAAVAARIDAARRLASATIEGPELDARWRAAAQRVRAGGAYGDLELRPQPGLLPLGPDPASGFEEFAHLQSGAPAARGGDGHLRIDGDCGIVLVLLPGGAFWLGAAAEGELNRDPLAESINEGPVHEGRLAPCLLSKYEMTQGQLHRVTGENPSVHSAVSIYVDDERAPLHPVESVDWRRARAVLHRLGLQLPTEAQWEYGARGGTTTPWYRGARVEDLLRPPAGNLADATSAAALGAQGWAPTPGLADGYVMHAPVGSYAPNAFGLFDMIGNVAEWCDDEYVSYATPPLPGTGARPQSAAATTVMYRGGAFDEPAQEARSANRAGGPPDRRHFDLGLRPARALAR